MELDLNELLPIFYEEAAEHLVTMEESLLKLEQSPENAELIDTIFRDAHSIKGCSSLVGFHEITNFTHGMENMLDLMRDGLMTTTHDHVELLLRATDTLAALITASQEGPPPEEVNALIAKVQAQVHSQQVASTLEAFSPDESNLTAAVTEGTECTRADGLR